ncbi:MAG: OmpA family protein [Pseudomonadota bacterium]
MLRAVFGVMVLLVGFWAPPLSAAGACQPSLIGGAPVCLKDERVAALPSALRESIVFFPAGGSGLDAYAQAQIALLSRVLATEPLAGTCLRFVGHSDASGDASVNAALSERRAKAVHDAISDAMGAAAPQAMEIAGMGEDAPLSEVPDTHVAQRRVEIWARPCPTG